MKDILNDSSLIVKELSTREAKINILRHNGYSEERLNAIEYGTSYPSVPEDITVEIEPKYEEIVEN